MYVWLETIDFCGSKEKTMKTRFDQLPLSADILDAIADKGYKNPTEIQERVITTFAEHSQDIYVQSQTAQERQVLMGYPF